MRASSEAPEGVGQRMTASADPPSAYSYEYMSAYSVPRAATHCTIR